MLETLAQLGSAIGGISMVVAVVALIREMRAQNLHNLFYLHQYLAQDDFADARRRVRTALHKLAYEDWSPEDSSAASKVCASYDQAGLLIGAGVLSDKTRKLFLGSSWGESICDQYEALDSFLCDRQTPSRTGHEFFHHFSALYTEASTYHRAPRGSVDTPARRAARVRRAERS